VKSTTLPQYSDPPKPSVPPYSPSPERDASISSTETIPASPQTPEEIGETPGSKSPITIDENPTEKARKKLQKEFDVLDADVKLRKEEMETRRETLRQLTENINISSTLLDNTDNLAVEVHNRLVSDYNDLRGEFNLDINTLNEDVQRLNKMAHKINRMGEQKYGNN